MYQFNDTEGEFDERAEDRSQPRYQPLNVPPYQVGSARPADWPSPASTSGPYPDPGVSSAQGSWGAYQPGAPVNPNRSYTNYGPGDYNNAGYSAQNGGYNPSYPPQNGSYPPHTAGFHQFSYGYPYPPMPQPIDPRRLAERKVNARLAFYRHLRTFVAVNAFLWLIAIVTLPVSHAHFWPVYITLFWGLGLFFQYRRTFGQSDRQRRRMIEEEMRRMKY